MRIQTVLASTMLSLLPTSKKFDGNGQFHSRPLTYIFELSAHGQSLRLYSKDCAKEETQNAEICAVISLLQSLVKTPQPTDQLQRLIGKPWYQTLVLSDE